MPPDFDPAACRHALDATEQAGVPPDVVAMLRRLVEEKANPWISVEDRLPERTEVALVVERGAYIVATWTRNPGFMV